MTRIGEQTKVRDWQEEQKPVTLSYRDGPKASSDKRMDDMIQRLPYTASTPHAYAQYCASFTESAKGVAAAALQQVGRSGVNSHALAVSHFPDEKSASAAFDAQKARLADVNNWTGLSGAENASFSLVGPDGKPAEGRSAQVGDFVKIRLPGSPTADWVQIESIQNGQNEFSIRVRPSHDPTKQPLTPDVVAHFFSREATNTFSVEKRGNDVQVRVLGHNESANVGATSGGLLNAARNRAVAEGAWGIQRPIPGTTTTVNGMQQHQWNRFTENLSQVR